MPSSTTSSDPQSTSIRVLLVDDNQAMLARAASVLTSDYVIVGTASSGQAALEAARSLAPDIIVLDVCMPGMSGFEVAECLRAMKSNAAVVFLTVYADEEFVEAGRAAGGMGYVVKSRLTSDLMTALLCARARRPFVSPAPDPSRRTRSFPGD